MDNGWILVVHDANLLENKAKIDIFDDQGQYLGQFHVMSFAWNRMAFHDGHLYTIESDEDGENQLVRYQYEVVTK